MARMASRPRIGAIIRDGIEHKGLRQREVAERLGVSRSAVNAWSNDRAYPASYVIVALEKLLNIKIPRAFEPPASLTVPRERELFRLLLEQVEDMTPEEALAVIMDARRRRAERQTA